MNHIADPTDEALQQQVENALHDAVGASAPHLGVAADAGTITVSGMVEDYNGHQVVLKAIEAVDGVRAVADELTVVTVGAPPADDSWIAGAAQHALQACDGIPVDSVAAEVRHGVVTLIGTVSSVAERLSAERAVIYLPGLTQINNRIHVAPRDEPPT